MNKLEQIATKCSKDKGDGYRCVDEMGRAYCSLLDPQSGHHGLCQYQGSLFLVRRNTAAGAYDQPLYFCGKPEKKDAP